MDEAEKKTPKTKEGEREVKREEHEPPFWVKIMSKRKTDHTKKKGQRGKKRGEREPVRGKPASSIHAGEKKGSHRERTSAVEEVAHVTHKKNQENLGPEEDRKTVRTIFLQRKKKTKKSSKKGKTGLRRGIQGIHLVRGNHPARKKEGGNTTTPA